MVTQAREEKIKAVIDKRQHGLILVLEDIHDPHNVQAIVRTCDAFGIQDVYLIFEKEEYFNPKRIGKSSSSSANKWVDFHIFRSTHECLKQLKTDSHILVATVADPMAQALPQSNLTDHRIAILVGNEHSGLSQEAITMADRTVTIPMYGMVQSLNVSVATALVLYETIRQRSGNPGKYKLPAEKQTFFIQDFLSRG